MKNNELYIYSFYRFLKIKNKKSIKNSLDKYFKEKFLRGTVLIADEGINASISGKKEDLLDTLKLVKKLLNIRKLNIKINKNRILPFNRTKVRLKKEIVSLGQGKIDVNKFTGRLVHPSDWNKLIRKKDIKIIDTRNRYEINIGKFKDAINPKTTSFREFPNKLEKIGIKKNDNLAIYCTGGIRCEKASAYLKLKGYKNISQLDGGILNYLDYTKQNKRKSLWQGDCFVFDNRVTVDKNLKKGKYLQCYGCRRPITKKDTLSVNYKKGVYCPYCFNSRSKKQKNSSLTRQNQIDRAELKKKYHPFKKSNILDISVFNKARN